MPTRLTYSRWPDDLLDVIMESMTFRLTRRSQRTDSEFTAFQKESDPTDVRWMASFTTALIKESLWSRIMSLVDQIGGTSGLVSLYDPLYFRPLGKATGTTDTNQRQGRTFSDGTRHTDGTFAMAVATIGRSLGNYRRGARQITITGMQADQSESLAEGDRFSILHGPLRIPTLYYAVRRAGSNAAGQTTVTIEPGLRYPVRIGDIIDFWKPRSLFKLVREPDFEVQAPLNSVVSLDFIEVPEFLDLPEIIGNEVNL